MGTIEALMLEADAIRETATGLADSADELRSRAAALEVAASTLENREAPPETPLIVVPDGLDPDGFDSAFSTILVKDLNTKGAVYQLLTGRSGSQLTGALWRLSDGGKAAFRSEAEQIWLQAVVDQTAGKAEVGAKGKPRVYDVRPRPAGVQHPKRYLSLGKTMFAAVVMVMTRAGLFDGVGLSQWHKE